MTTETMKQEIKALAARGWEIDDAARGVEFLYRLRDYPGTVQLLIALGKAAEDTTAMPTIRVENGTEVRVRLGRPPSPGLTRDEIELAKKLTELAQSLTEG